MTVSLLGPKDWDRFHKAAVLSALERAMHQGQATGNPLATDAELFAAYQSLIAEEVPAVIVNGKYLIVYDVGPTFFTSKLTLFEILVTVLGNDPGPGLSVIPKALEQLAKQHGCVSIATGNSTGRKGLTRMYERAGFKPLSVQFYKEVP